MHHAWAPLRQQAGLLLEQFARILTAQTDGTLKQLLRLGSIHPVLGASRLKRRRPLCCTARRHGPTSDDVQSLVHADGTAKHARTRHREAQPDLIADATQRARTRSHLRPRASHTLPRRIERRPLRSRLRPVSRTSQLVGHLTPTLLRQSTRTERQIGDRIQRHIAYEADDTVPPLAQIDILITENVAKPVMGSDLVAPIGTRETLTLHQVDGFLHSGHRCAAPSVDHVQTRANRPLQDGGQGFLPPRLLRLTVELGHIRQPTLLGDLVGGRRHPPARGRRREASRPWCA